MNSENGRESGACTTDRGPKDSDRIEQLLDFYGFLIQANGLVARAGDIDQLYSDICRLGVRLDRRLVLAWVGITDPGSIEVRVVAHAGSASGYLEDLHVSSVAADARGRGPTGRTLREGRCVIVNRFLEDPSTELWHAKARRFGIASSAAIPLRRKGEVCGALMLYGNTIDVFDERIAGELDVLSQTLSYAIDAADERSARKALETRLLESRQEMREALQVVEASPVVCFRWRAEPGWPVDYVSRNVSRWGWRAADLVAGRPPFEQLVHAEDLPRVASEARRHAAAGLNEYVQRFRLRRADGSWFWVENSTRVVRDTNGEAVAYEGVVADVDADVRREQNLAQSLELQLALNRKLEAAQNQLLQSEKLASIGQLAAGVAHEINNPIGFVSSNVGTLTSYLSRIFGVLDICDAAAKSSTHPDEFAQFRKARQECELDFLRTDTVQLLQESKDGLERVRKIVQDLKDFSHAGEVKWEWADVHQGIDSTLNIVWNELKYNCRVEKRYGALPQIFCVVSQLNQVFMNLLINAAQAIEMKGEIVIATERVGDDAIRIRISDTGRGIASEHLHRVFEPFFSTKPVGKGRGLGLSLAWGIVQHHQGQIEVASEPGKGTTFTITLPIEPAASAADTAHAADEGRA